MYDLPMQTNLNALKIPNLKFKKHGSITSAVQFIQVKID